MIQMDGGQRSAEICSRGCLTLLLIILTGVERCRLSPDAVSFLSDLGI